MQVGSWSVRTGVLGAALAVGLGLAGCTVGESAPPADLVVYTGRQEALIAELVAGFEQEAGHEVEVRYGDSAELAVQLLEEGDRTPADVFWSQDAGSLGAVADAGLFTPIDPAVLDKVPAAYRSADGLWVGTSGRARVLVYDPRTVSDAELPTSVHDLTAERWAGAVGIAPTNASFQAFVTAMRVSEGESAATAWLDDMAANDAQAYESNTLILDAVDAGEIQLGLINHYYYYELADEVGEENINARLTFLAPGDPGSLVNAAGVGILDEDNPVAAEFAEYLLTEEAQRYVVDTNAEYPLVDSVDARPGLPPLESLKGAGVPLDDLDDLAGTLALLTETGWI